MNRFLLMGSSAVVRAMSPRTPAAKLMALPPQALAMIERSDPAPLSAFELTTRLISLRWLLSLLVWLALWAATSPARVIACSPMT